jgi:hypothetical protein
MLIILLVVLLVLSLGALPSWPYSRDWGYTRAEAWASSWWFS